MRCADSYKVGEMRDLTAHWRPKTRGEKTSIHSYQNVVGRKGGMCSRGRRVTLSNVVAHNVKEKNSSDKVQDFLDTDSAVGPDNK